MQGRRQLRTWGRIGALMIGLAAFLVPASPAHAAGTVTPDKPTLDLGDQRVGTFGALETVKFTFTGDDVTTDDFGLTSTGDFDFFPVVSDCFEDDGEGKTFSDGETCTVGVIFFALDYGDRTGQMHLESDAADSPETVNLEGNGTVGYYLAGAAGQVAGFGDAEDFGDMSDADLNEPIINMATAPNGDGYWLLGEDGGVFSFNVDFHGSMGGKPLNQPIVGLAPTPSGEGYWLVALDGGIFAFGDAEFYGSMGGKPLNEPIVGIAPTPTGEGYWLVALDGGIFAFGDAEFFGSMGGKPLNEPVVGIASTPSGEGYHMVATDGGMFQFGDAKFFGSMGGKPLNLPMIDMALFPTGEGYWTVAIDGGVFSFGKAPFLGGLGKEGAVDVVAVSGTAPLIDVTGGSQSGSVNAQSSSRGLRSADELPQGRRLVS